MRSSHIKIWVLFFIMVQIHTSCTDLDEELLSEITAENYYQSDAEFVSAIGSAYTSLGFIGGHGNIWTINEVASDELVITTKGADWYDENALQLHKHTFNPHSPSINASWSTNYQGINNCNRLISEFEKLVENGNQKAEPYIYELRALRALFYYWLLDAFGNVPIYVDFTAESPPSNNRVFQAGRTEVYNFVELELTSAIPYLNPAVGGVMYGRMNQAAALALRAKLYLNAEVFTGGAKQEYAKAIADVDEVSAMGFSLASSYKDNFAIENEGSPENIFVVPYDENFFQGFVWAPMTLHYASQGTYNFNFQPWNGYAVVEEFYNSYIDPGQNPGPQGLVWSGLADFDPVNDKVPNNMGTLDSRLSNFLVGPQFNADGSPTQDLEYEDETYPNPDPDGPRLNFTPHNNELFPYGWRQGGARIGKYEYELGGNENQSNDFVIFRYADILLTKAEALWRMGDIAGALIIVNELRSRAGVDPLADLDAPPSFNPTGADIPGGEILNERGREMFGEMTRRQDLIRFNLWGEAWWEKEQSPEQFKVFPIPQYIIDTSPSLYQNPEYE